MLASDVACSGIRRVAACNKSCGLAHSMSSFLRVSLFLIMGFYCTARMVSLKCMDGRPVVCRHRAYSVREQGLQNAEYGDLSAPGFSGDAPW